MGGGGSKSKSEIDLTKKASLDEIDNKYNKFKKDPQISHFENRFAVKYASIVTSYKIFLIWLLVIFVLFLLYKKVHNS